MESPVRTTANVAIVQRRHCRFLSAARADPKKLISEPAPRNPFSVGKFVLTIVHEKAGTAQLSPSAGSRLSAFGSRAFRVLAFVFSFGTYLAKTLEPKAESREPKAR